MHSYSPTKEKTLIGKRNLNQRDFTPPDPLQPNAYGQSDDQDMLEFCGRDNNTNQIRSTVASVSQTISANQTQYQQQQNQPPRFPPQQHPQYSRLPQNYNQEDEGVIETIYDSIQSDSDEEMKMHQDITDFDDGNSTANFNGNSSNNANQQQNKYYKYNRKKRSSENKKLVFLSKKVLEEVSTKHETTGTNIANHILEIYKERNMKLDFKNVQRRVYDALNVLSALDVITKDRNKITFKGYNGILQHSPRDSNGLQNGSDLQFQESARLYNNQVDCSNILIITHEFIIKAKIEIEEAKNRLQQKTAHFLELAQQSIALKKLVARNYMMYHSRENQSAPEKKIDIPFVVLKLQKNAQVELQQKDDQTQLILQTDRELEMFNENHILQKLQLNKITKDDIKNLLPTHIQQHLHERYNVEDEQLIENQLYCDEAPLTSSEIIHSQQSQNAEIEYQSQPNYDNNIFSQHSYYDSRGHQNNHHQPHIRKQSDFGGNQINLISNPNSIQNTPMKQRYNQYSQVSQYGQALSFGTLRGNQFNLTSPYRHVSKNESIDIHNSFMDKNDQYNYLSSPFYGSSNIIMGNDVFNEMESTNYYSNFTNIPQSRDKVQTKQGIQTKSPINVNNYMQNPNSQSSNNENLNNRDTPLLNNQTKYLGGKVSPLGVPSLSNILQQ
eukprot:403355038